MESLDGLFNTERKCKEHDCSVNNKNVHIIYKPDNGFLDKAVEREFLGTDYKICDCIIECNDGNLIIIEILCGNLTNRELKEKKEQLMNCCKVVKNLKEFDKIKKLILLYKKIDVMKKELPQFRKKLINQRICNKPLIITNKIADINC